MVCYLCLEGTRGGAPEPFPGQLSYAADLGQGLKSYPSSPHLCRGLTTSPMRSWNPFMRNVAPSVCLSRCSYFSPWFLTWQAHVGVSGLLLGECVLSLGEDHISHPHLQVAVVRCREAVSPSVLFAWILPRY